MNCSTLQVETDDIGKLRPIVERMNNEAAVLKKHKGLMQ